MPHSRWLAWTGIALGTFASLAGCLRDGGSGDPAVGFGHPSGGDTYAGETSPGTGGQGGSNGGHHDGGSAGSGGANDAGSSACVEGATSTFSFAWTLESATGTASSCDAAGGKTVDIQIVSAASGATAVAAFPCTALAATTCAMRGGAYAISMKLRDAQGATISEIVAPTLFLADGQNTAVASLPFQVGGDTSKGRGFALTWSIDKLGTHAVQTCTQAGAATVRLTAGSTKFDMACADGKGRTTSVAPGDYPVSLDLLDGAGAVLSETQTMTISVGAGQLVFLGDVPFDVN
jgi:hypothetical protein